MVERASVQMFDPHNAKNGFRAKRFLRFRELLLAAASDRGTVKVLELGGDTGYWRAFAHLWHDLPLELTILNRYQAEPAPLDFSYRQGDACDLHDIGDGEFDVVHSNSVIEHVGNWAKMHAFAREARRVGKRYFIQTPNFWFPIEPHLRLPWVHWLPDQKSAIGS